MQVVEGEVINSSIHAMLYLYVAFLAMLFALITNVTILIFIIVQNSPFSLP